MEELVTKQEGDVLIVYLKGRLDVHLSLEIEQAVNELIDKGHINLLFDLEKVVYLSSSGLRIFIAADDWDGNKTKYFTSSCRCDFLTFEKGCLSSG